MNNNNKNAKESSIDFDKGPSKVHTHMYFMNLNCTKIALLWLAILLSCYAGIF